MDNIKNDKYYIQKISDEYKQGKSYIPWNSLYGLRNRIVHDYGNVDLKSQLVQKLDRRHILVVVVQAIMNLSQLLDIIILHHHLHGQDIQVQLQHLHVAKMHHIQVVLAVL